MPPLGDGRHPALSDTQHWAGFLVSGTVAFLTDAGLLWVLTELGLSPFIARVGALMQAMVVAWLCHRTLTFRVSAPPSLSEFLRYAAVAWTAAALNYAIFAGILLIWPAIRPFYAMAASSIGAMAFSYVGMRVAAFRR